MDFKALTSPVHLGDTRFSIEVPDGWQQGRGAFGGFTVAVLVRAIETAEPDDERPLRSLTAELCGPLLPGPASVVVEVLRRGTGMTTVAARIIQDGIVAHAVGILAKSRVEVRHDGLAPPERKPYEDVHPMPETPFAPPFTHFFEYRITGDLPFSGSDKAVVETWLRMRLASPAVDAAYVAAMADATWPALFPLMSEPRPMSTVSYTLQLFGPFDDVSPADPLYYRGSVLAARDGHLAEMRELWTPSGRLVALNHQTIALIR